MGDDAIARFNEIRDELGLEGGMYDDAQREALGLIGKWLQEGAKDPGVVVLAGQTLFADGESTSPAAKHLPARFRQRLGDQWGKLAQGDQRLLALQAMILANWNPKTMATGNYRALALMASPWWAVPTASRGLRKWIEPLLAAVSAPVQPEKAPSLPSVAPISLAAQPSVSIVDRATFDSRVEHVRAHMQGNTAASAYGQQMNEVLVWLRQSQDQLQTATQSSQNALKTFGDNLQSTLATWVIEANKALKKGSPDAFPTEEILWWGAARYSHRKQKPLREMDSREARRTWAALELAARAKSWQCEPCASYLVETLIALDVDPSESRLLGEWLQELHRTLRDEEVALHERLTALLRESAIALPVLRVLQNHREELDVARLAQETMLPFDEPVKSSRWTAWLFRECLLAEMFRGPA